MASFSFRGGPEAFMIATEGACPSGGSGGSGECDCSVSEDESQAEQLSATLMDSGSTCASMVGHQKSLRPTQSFAGRLDLLARMVRVAVNNARDVLNCWDEVVDVADDVARKSDDVAKGARVITGSADNVSKEVGICVRARALAKEMEGTSIGHFQQSGRPGV